MDEIVNKVANSKLEVFDLEDYFPKAPIVELDISQWLLEGFILKEKDFRETLKNYEWQQFSGQNVALFCVTDAILPAWTYSLVATYLAPFANAIVQGDKKAMLLSLYQKELSKIDFQFYADKPVILKGCSNKPVPNEVYVLAIQELQKVGRSVMFGEACSAVPLYKKGK
ncbi:DUF2480 family protein [Flavobacterium chuncheonense]|uniref:DUF2480 family protein n=1 Tax=Flavobacterium chuncheonense TaxID=2026653 RepID=A0ABW5YMB4_9FLAO